MIFGISSTISHTKFPGTIIFKKKENCKVVINKNARQKIVEQYCSLFVRPLLNQNYNNSLMVSMLDVVQAEQTK